MNEPRYDVAIVGGGPAGSTAAMYLAAKNFSVCVIEKASFPRETLCGEFLSREVSQILEEVHLGGAFLSLHPNALTSLRFCPEGPQSYTADLPFSAYGLKRGTFDTFLLDRAARAGAVIYQPKTVKAIHRADHGYDVLLKSPEGPETLTARFVIAAHGKSSLLDRTSDRKCQKGRSRLNGIKFHVPKKYMPNVPEHEIQLYTGRDMYCGVNVVNDNTVTLCFLEERSPDDIQPRAKITGLMKTNQSFAQSVSGDFEAMLSSFPIYGSADIHFGKKHLVKDGVFAIGDAAQVIAPLAGDGIGMAMESARIISNVLAEGREQRLPTDAMASLHAGRWKASFQRRLRIAKGIQRIVLSRVGTSICRLALSGLPSLLPRTIEYTRG